jgi:uroporphyrinogen-III synthase
MAGTRSSARNADKNSSPVRGDDAVAGTKRKPEAEPSPKRSRKATKKQATLEESGITKDSDSEMKDADASDHSSHEKTKSKTSDDQSEAKDGENKIDGETKANASDIAPEADTTTSVAKDKTDDAKPKTVNEAAKSENSGDGAIETSSQREKEMPSNILEKGVICKDFGPPQKPRADISLDFFTRNRVGIDDADSVGDLQRTFFVLRPLPKDAKLGEGAIPDLKNNRLFALPKKTFPKSHNDRFMAFVEKANTSVQQLKDEFFKGSEYETKTQGTRQVDPVTPVAEGVYAITRTEDRTTHLIYSTTIPSDLGEIQQDLGIKDQGSFVISVKNPERSGPASASLPQKPDFPKEYVGMSWVSPWLTRVESSRNFEV